MSAIRFNYPLHDAAQAKLRRVYDMLMLAYSALLTVALTLSAPWWLARMATTQRYREGLRQRLGLIPADLRERLAGRRVVWLHAVSVGEVLAATRLVAELEAALGEGWTLLVSTTTRTGQALARQRFDTSGTRSRVFYMPLDFAFAVRAYLKALQPAALILMESELWPRLLHECAARRIPVAVVNARLSDRSFRRAWRFRSLWSRVLRQPALWLAQSDEDARRLHALTASPALPTPPQVAAFATAAQRPAASGAPHILTIGNLKYDIRAPRQSRAAERIREIANGRPILVAGSTVGDSQHDEESFVTTAWGGRPSNEYSVLLVLAPRHPERFASAWQDASKFPAARLTELLRDTNTPPTGGSSTKPTSAIDIVLVDTIGDLSAIYGIADVAFVGGSLLQRGGHNPLEPAQYGVPVVMGPSYENFRDIVQKMKDADGISILGEAVGLSAASARSADFGRDDKPLVAPFVDALEAELVRLLADRPAAKALGERGRAVFEQQQGATARTLDELLNMLGQSKTHPAPPNAGAPYLDSEMRAGQNAEARP